MFIPFIPSLSTVKKGFRCHDIPRFNPKLNSRETGVLKTKISNTNGGRNKFLSQQ